MEVMNRFKGLYLVDRVPEELWMEICNIVQEVVTKSIHRKRNSRRQNGFVMRPYKQLRSEKQRKNREICPTEISRRNKKTFLNEQCKETKENNRMGKTRYFFKKTGDTKGTFHAKMGSMHHLGFAFVT